MQKGLKPFSTRESSLELYDLNKEVTKMNGQDPRDNIPYVTPARFNAMFTSVYDKTGEFGGTLAPSRSTLEKARANKDRLAYDGPNLDSFVMNAFDMPGNDIEKFARQAAEEKTIEQRANLERLADAILEEHYLAQPRKTLEAGSQEPSYQDIVMKNASMDEKYGRPCSNENLQAHMARDLNYKEMIKYVGSRKEFRKCSQRIDNSKRRKLRSKTSIADDVVQHQIPPEGAV
jgi:hypothetical protein